MYHEPFVHAPFSFFSCRCVVHAGRASRNWTARLADIHSAQARIVLHPSDRWRGYQQALHVAWLLSSRRVAAWYQTVKWPRRVPRCGVGLISFVSRMPIAESGCTLFKEHVNHI